MRADRIILGTVQFGLEYGINNQNGIPGDEELDLILHRAHEVGVTELDSAEAYGNALSRIGRFMKETGKSFRINSKISFSESEPAEERVRKTLSLIDDSQVHTLFFHRFADMSDNQLFFEEIVRLKRLGMVKYIGASIYTNEEFEFSINQEQVDVIQFPFNLLDNFSFRGGLIRKAKDAGKILQVRSVFLQGLFFRKPELLPPKTMPLQAAIEEVQAIARENAIAVKDLCLMYALSIKPIDKIIVGVDNVAQLEANLNSLDLELSGEIRRKIESINIPDRWYLNPLSWL